MRIIPTNPKYGKSVNGEIATTCLGAISPTGERQTIYPKLQRPQKHGSEAILGRMRPGNWYLKDLLTPKNECKFLLIVRDGAGVNKRICRYLSAEMFEEGLNLRPRIHTRKHTHIIPYADNLSTQPA